jgi:hypothetical protein
VPFTLTSKEYFGSLYESNTSGWAAKWIIIFGLWPSINLKIASKTFGKKINSEITVARC